MDKMNETPGLDFDTAGGSESVHTDSDNISVAGSAEADNSTPKSRTRLEWAQWMASKGITAFIVDANSKRPLGGSSWYVRNTTEPEQLAEWFEMTPNCNYGLWLGEEYVVIDLDVKHDLTGVTGIAAFEEICRENGIEDFRYEIDTLMVETPSGGYHLYFKTPRPCANRHTFPAHIDVRGAVGYVVGPGSKIDAGEWEVEDENAPIMDIPDFLLGYLESPGQKDPNHEVPLIELDLTENVQQAMDFLAAEPPAIEGDNGDQHTYEVCCYLRDFGLSEAEALRVMFESGWNARCDPPWDASHLEVKVENSYAYGQNRPGCKAESYRVGYLKAARRSMGLTGSGAGIKLAVDNTATACKLDDEPERASPFKVRDEAEQDSQPDIKWLIEGVLQEMSLTLIYGPENSLKSFLVLDLCLCAAAGIAWASYGAQEGHGGFPIPEPLTTLYIAGEGARGVEKRRRPIWRDFHKIDKNRKLPFYTMNEMPRFQSEVQVDEMIEQIEEAGMGVFLRHMQPSGRIAREKMNKHG